MAKTILVPVDFTVQSLNTLKHALSNNEGKELQVRLLYAQLLPDSITDLLFYSPQKEIRQLIKPNFEQALDVLKNKFEKKIQDIHIKVLHSNNGALLENILLVERVTEIYIPKSYRLKTNGRGFDPLPLLRNAAVPVYEIAWEPRLFTDGVDEMDALFN